MTAKRHGKQASNPGDAQAAARHIASGNHEDKDTNSLRVVTGSEHKALNSILVNDALRTLWLGPNPSEERRDALYSAAMSALMEFKPTDGIEGMMAVQALGLHSASVECLRRAMLPDQSSETTDRLRKQAANMIRAFLDVLAALDRKRGKGGQQLVRVERVMVAPGGQAVVGNVQTGPAVGTGQQRDGVRA